MDFKEQRELENKFLNEKFKLNFRAIDKTHDLIHSVDRNGYESSEWRPKRIWIILNYMLSLAEIGLDWKWYEKQKYHLTHPGGVRYKRFLEKEMYKIVDKRNWKRVRNTVRAIINDEY